MGAALPAARLEAGNRAAGKNQHGRWFADGDGRVLFKQKTVKRAGMTILTKQTLTKAKGARTYSLEKLEVETQLGNGTTLTKTTANGATSTSVRFPDGLDRRVSGGFGGPKIAYRFTSAGSRITPDNVHRMAARISALTHGRDFQASFAKHPVELDLDISNEWRSGWPLTVRLRPRMSTEEVLGLFGPRDREALKLD